MNNEKDNSEILYGVPLEDVKEILFEWYNFEKEKGRMTQEEFFRAERKKLGNLNNRYDDKGHFAHLIR